MKMPLLNIVDAAFAHGSRESRLFRYLEQYGEVHRDRLMHFCGFPSPLQQPVSAYVSFHNAVLRLNEHLRAVGACIEGGIHTEQRYRIVRA